MAACSLRLMAGINFINVAESCGFSDIFIDVEAIGPYNVSFPLHRAGVCGGGVGDISSRSSDIEAQHTQ